MRGAEFAADGGQWAFALAQFITHGGQVARQLAQLRRPDVGDEAPVDEATYLGLTRAPAEMLRGSNMFADPVEVNDDASPQDRLIAFTGRQP